MNIQKTTKLSTLKYLNCIVYELCLNKDVLLFEVLGIKSKVLCLQFESSATALNSSPSIKIIFLKQPLHWKNKITRNFLSPETHLQVQ